MTSRYEIRIARRAGKSLNALERRGQQRIRAAIELLAENVRPPACVAVSGEQDVYRVPVGDSRIVYEVVDSLPIVHVVRVGHRRKVYR